MSDKYKEIVEQVDAAFGANNIEGFLELCAEDVKWEIIGDKTIEGKDAIRQFAASMGGMAPPKIENRRMIADGDSVAAHGTVTMASEAGKNTAYEYCDIYRFENEKIVELLSYVIKNHK